MAEDQFQRRCVSNEAWLTNEMCVQAGFVVVGVSEEIEMCVQVPTINQEMCVQNLQIKEMM